MQTATRPRASGTSHRRIPGLTVDHLDQLIDALIAGVILIDPAGVILGANAAALRMHGVARIEDLGLTVDGYGQRFTLRYRNNHRLPRREYPLMRLLAGESFPDLVVEVSPFGQEEPCWVHQVRDVAMENGSGDPECLALIIHDVSERYEAEGRFEALFHANPAPALIVRIADQRFVRINQGFIDLSGFARDALVGKSLFEVGLFTGADRGDVVRSQIAAGTTIAPIEIELPLADGGTRLVLAAARPIEVSDEACLLFTFADLEPRRRVEQARDAGDAHLATVFALAPLGMAITRAATFGIVEVNAAFRDLAGHEAATTGDRSFWGDAAQRSALAAEIDAHGTVRNVAVRISGADGAAIDCLVSAARISFGGEACVLWLYQDVTARRQSELELVEAIDAVMQDAGWFAHSIMDRLAAKRRAPEAGAPPPTELSQREHDVLELICRGLDNAAISQRLSIAPNTVRNHIARLYAKIGVNRRAAAILWAREHGLH